eukprot:5997818-Pyramimonas_sp.AAC.1
MGVVAASGPLSLVQGLTANSPTNIQWMAHSPQTILLLRTVGAGLAPPPRRQILAAEARRGP